MIRRPEEAVPEAITEADREDVARRWDVAMRAGDFAEAWRQTDRIEQSRRRDAAAGTLVHAPHHLIWDGSPFDDRDVLVRCNHGLGDTLQFIRYVPALRAVARSVTVLAQPALVGFLSSARIFGDVRDAWTDEPPPPHDVEIEVMELPYAFRSSLDRLPCGVPYIPLRGLRAASAQLPPLAEDSALHVGLVWASSKGDPTRSIPLAALAAWGDVPGIRFHSLQQGPRSDEARDAPFTLERLSEHTAEISACAAALLKLDLVITVDCMVAHLAGALGRPVWVMLQREADWRWMHDRADCPWYPTMRLFRQEQQGDWSDVVQGIGNALAVRARSPRPRRGARRERAVG